MNFSWCLFSQAVFDFLLVLVVLNLDLDLDKRFHRWHHDCLCTYLQFSYFIGSNTGTVSRLYSCDLWFLPFVRKRITVGRRKKDFIVYHWFFDNSKSSFFCEWYDVSEVYHSYNCLSDVFASPGNITWEVYFFFWSLFLLMHKNRMNESAVYTV